MVCSPALHGAANPCFYHLAEIGGVMQLDADVYLCGEAILMRCRGRITFGDEPMRLARRVHKMGSPARRIILDLSALESLSTGDLGALIVQYLGARSAGYQVALTCVPDHVMEVLTATGTACVFEIHDSPRTAGLVLPDVDPFAAAAS